MAVTSSSTASTHLPRHRATPQCSGYLRVSFMVCVELHSGTYTMALVVRNESTSALWLRVIARFTHPVDTSGATQSAQRDSQARVSFSYKVFFRKCSALFESENAQLHIYGACPNPIHALNGKPEIIYCSSW